MTDHLLAVDPTNFTLSRNPAGQLQLTTLDQTVFEGVYPVRAFPISAPDDGLSLMAQEGYELVWVPNLSLLSEQTRRLITEELSQREFMPEIIRIIEVSSFATPSLWKLDTDRGEAELLLKSEDHIRRLGHNSLLITDGHGVNFLLRKIDQLDTASRKLLDRFL